MTESIDSPNLQLPDNQDSLISAVAAVNPRTVVVLETGGSVTMSWLDRVAGVIEAWYPGARGAGAVAAVLSGQVNPSGRLPVTFPKSESQLPRPAMLDPQAPGVVSNPSATADISHHFDVDYNIEGADLGYRWYQRKQLEPLFPFGSGLSYTTFAHSDLKATARNGTIEVAFAVANTGKRSGWDTPQVYVALPDGSPRRLVGWDKLSLEPGKSARVELKIDPRMLARFKADDSGWQLAAGSYRVSLRKNAADEQGPVADVELKAASLAP